MVAISGHFQLIFPSFHFPIIFHFIFIPFFVRLKLRMNKKMYLKWNPNLAFAKNDQKWSFFTFLAMCLMRKMHFHFIFLNFASQNVHSNYFSHHCSFPFTFPFICSPAKYMKMTWKWDWKLWVLFIELILMWNGPFSGGITVLAEGKCQNFALGVLALLGQRALLCSVNTLYSLLFTALATASVVPA